MEENKALVLLIIGYKMYSNDIQKDTIFLNLAFGALIGGISINDIKSVSIPEKLKKEEMEIERFKIKLIENINLMKEYLNLS